HALADIIATHKPGDEVTLEVQRGPAIRLPQKEIESTESTSDEANRESEESEEAASETADDQDAQTDPTQTAPAVGMHQRQTETIVVTLGENPDKAGGAYLGIYYTDYNDGVNVRPFANGPMAENRFFARPFDSQPFGQYRFFHSVPHAYGMPGDMPNAGMETQAVIMQVLPDSPAAAAGLQKDEVIVALNGEPLTDPAQLKEQIAQLAPGDEIVLTVRQPAQAIKETDSDKTDSEEAVPAESNAEDTGAEREVTVTLGENEQGETWLGVKIGLLIQMNQTDTQ
ncbi:MAG: PDZ domain-containing protein, partial [Caldilineaceae bacterium]|nr:PDZ domain-containing protein [Caldilineaceae bacterium]